MSGPSLGAKLGLGARAGAMGVVGLEVKGVCSGQRPNKLKGNRMLEGTAGKRLAEHTINNTCSKSTFHIGLLLRLDISGVGFFSECMHDVRCRKI